MFQPANRARVIALLTATFLFLLFTSNPVLVRTQAKANADDQAAGLTQTLTSILEDQVAAWNQGDIDTFMQAYWKSEQLTFSSGGKTQRGWETTRSGYKERYPDQATMGQLTFSDYEVQLLDANAALVLGRWQLERDDPIGGNFSLVWKKIDEQWFIIHDHTSLEPK